MTPQAEELVNYPGLDAVLVTSPHTLHYEHARLALQRGLHVLCEKPMCTRGEDARELVRLAEARSIFESLVERGVIVRCFDSGALAGCLRLTVGTPDENAWLIDAFTAILRAQK